MKHHHYLALLLLISGSLLLFIAPLFAEATWRAPHDSILEIAMAAPSLAFSFAGSAAIVLGLVVAIFKPPTE